MRAEGTPMDDHRASAAYRTATLGTALLKLHAETATPAGGRSMSALSERPANPVVGQEIPHEAARCT